jgi:hypothetical protein
LNPEPPAASVQAGPAIAARKATLIATLLCMGLVWIRLGILETPVSSSYSTLTRSRRPRSSKCVRSSRGRSSSRHCCGRRSRRRSTSSPLSSSPTRSARCICHGTSSSPRCVSFVSIPLFGHISDRIGRKKMYLIGVVLTGLFDSYISGWWIWQSRHPVGGLHRHRALAHSPRYAIRTAGGADRGVIHTALAVQRRLPRLSARIHNCRRPRANHRHRAVRRLSYGLCDREDFSRANRDFPAML